jgi:hypothetical protein
MKGKWVNVVFIVVAVVLLVVGIVKLIGAF